MARENGPDRLVMKARILFDEGPLASIKLVGFGLWKGANSELYVTFPSRPLGAGAERW